MEKGERERKGKEMGRWRGNEKREVCTVTFRR